ncbi:TetR/AcrR family transcriptional regulator [Streptomyces sp. CS014]|uniref:TetR/AcrR family transcriptional regulator n=1 Tax=Streptomyces sp. CS014 TaxID=2162707 RepID=UPI000D506CDB|nr:TetR/AcrR family transcriptional regulator [Streptomyces sp. CS014]PVC91661.1 TetR family transcriptional regulator [Streptomyces sp. CS014]
MTTKADTEPPKGRPKDPRVDAALLDAAIEVLNESGWAAFTTTAVARRAGASTASLYRRWPSKQALAGAVARHIALDELGGIGTGSLEGDIRELLARKRRILETATGPALLSLMGQAPHDPELRQILHDDVYLVVRDQLEALTAQAVRRGELDAPVDAARLDVLTLVLVGATLARSVFLAPGPVATPTAASATSTSTAETELHLLLAALPLRGAAGG